MRNRTTTAQLLRSIPLVLAAAAMTGCGQDDLTVAVAEDASGASMGVAAEPETDTSPAPSGALDGAAVAESGEATVDPAIDGDGGSAAGVDEAPPVAAEAGEPESAAPAADAEGSDVADMAEAADLVAIGHLSTAADRTELPPVDEPEVPPAESAAAASTGDGDTAGAAEKTDDPAENAADAADDEPYSGEWQPPPVEEPKLVDGVWHVSFDYLGSFDTGILALPEDSPMAIEARREQQVLAEKAKPEPDGTAKEPDDIPVDAPIEIGFPDAVRKMDGQTVRIEGYMIPLKFDDGKVKSFFLSRYMMGCCFGVLPKANEIIEVEMADGKGAFYDAYMPFVTTGKLEIVEEGTDDDYMQSVFRMTADSCDYSEDW